MLDANIHMTENFQNGVATDETEFQLITTNSLFHGMN